MTPHDREALFTSAIWAAARLRATEPDRAVLRSIEQQLFYLVGVVRGTLPADRVNQITLGALAARQIPDWDADLAKLLVASAAEARVMQTEAVLAGGRVAKS